MTVLISLLRAVNLASHNRISMAGLREVYESLGFTSVRTYVQSGNVIFSTAAKDLPRIARRIESALEQAFGFRPDVILRTPAELRDVIARNPFDSFEPGKLLVTFLARDPGPEAADKVAAIRASPEQLRLLGRELYIYYPNGAGRSKLPQRAIEKALNTPGTARNWNTVTKLAAMSQAGGHDAARPA